MDCLSYFLTVPETGTGGMNFGNLGNMSLPVQFATPLSGVAWAVLAGIPVGIVALYFLKLRRRPVQVPSTLLWRRSLEDLHVNSLFQRLRKNLLLFLQLLAVLLAMLALAGPRVAGTTGQGQRFVLAIDNSASMRATDVAPSRLERAKQQAKEIIQDMDSDDLAMVIAFADRAKIVSNYTGDRRQLLQRIDAITSTDGATSLREALQVAAGLANPSKQVGEGAVASLVATPKLKIYTDGGFADVEGFSLGNLEPEVIVIGPPPPPLPPAEDNARTTTGIRTKVPSDNVAILALESRRNDERPDTYQVFGRVHNYRGQEVATEAQLSRHDADKPHGEGTLIDAIALTLAASERPVLQVRPARLRYRRAGDPADRRRRPAARQSRVHYDRQPEEGASPRCHQGKPLPGGHPEDTDGRRARRCYRGHSRGVEGRRRSSATSSRAATTW